MRMMFPHHRCRRNSKPEYRANVAILSSPQQHPSPHPAAYGEEPTAREKPAHLHSMTSSARARLEGGTVRPSALAVLRLTTSSNRVGCSTGRSAGLSPLRILPV